MALAASTIMHDLPRGDDTPTRKHQTEFEAEPPTPDALTSVVVAYERRADRQTVFPADCPDEQVLTTWLSARAEAFVDLGAHR